MKSKPGHWRWLAVLVVVLMVALTACTSGVAQEDYDALQAELDQAKTDLEAAQAQIGGAPEASQVVQAGELAPALEPVAIGDDGWTNAESVRGGLILVATFDSSGPDAWDITKHPRVYYTSESYAGSYFEATDEGKNLKADPNFENFAGYHVIDAYTKEVVFSNLLSYQGSITRGPHGVGVSPDGKWVYVGWSESVDPDADRINYVAIVNARTGKMDKLLKQESYFEGGMRGQALHHIQAWTDAEGNDRVILQWGFGANGGPHHILDPNDNNRVFRSITYDDVKPMGHPFTTPSPDGHYVYISMGANWIRSNHSPAAAIAKLDVNTGESTIIEGVGWHPIGITHTQDGKYTYVIDGHSSHVYKIDDELNEVVDETSAGVAGPYGICLNWDETQAWVDGKGEGSHNRGNSMGVIDLVDFRPWRTTLFNQPFYLGGSASSIDHCALHPDPEVNEIWVSNMNGWETIVVNLDTYKVTDYIATPHHGDTHGMAFVWYDGGWDNGELQADMGGPKSATMKAEVLKRATEAAAANS